MAYCSKLKCFCIVFVASLCQLAAATERVQIVKIMDANRFVTADSLTISLSNVSCFSIADADSFKRAFANMVLRNAEKMLRGRELIAEVQNRNDSLILVHLWEKRGIIGKWSLNEVWLANGWGWYEEMPSSRYSKNYQWAARQAERGFRGIHDKAILRRPEPAVAGQWLSFGLGRGECKGNRSNAHDALLLDLGIHFREKKWIFSGGSQGIYLTEATSAGGLYLLAGRSFYGEGAEMAVSIGGSINRWRYDTESIRGTIRSKPYPGLQAKAQMLGHFRQALGIGLDLDANLNKEKSYYAFSLHLILGGWEYAR